MSELAISVKNVSKYYKLYSDSSDRLKEALHPFSREYHEKFYALSNLSLDVYKGDIIGIVGKNGCGKSTLLKIITGVLQVSSGGVAVNGKITALLELGAGFNQEFTGLENIRYYSSILGLTPDEIEERLEKIVEFAEIGTFINQPVKTYSSGMRARLGFAVAVHVDPEILILDEVLAVGDALFKRKCYAKMREFFKSGKTILYVSHDAKTVNQLCNRAVLIHEGKIILDDEPKTVTQYYERILFSKANKTEKIVDEVREKEKEKQAKKTEEVHNNKGTIAQEPARGTSKNEDESKKLKPYYLEELITKTAVVYQDYKIEIHDPHFETLQGDRVNVLVSGESYRYKFDVIFREDAEHVSFGMQVKDQLGSWLSAASMHITDRLIETVKKGEKIAVTWTIDCPLLAGTYFTNAGVSSHHGGDITILARITDAVAFRIISEKDSMVKGLIDMNQAVEFESIEELIK